MVNLIGGSVLVFIECGLRRVCKIGVFYFLKENLKVKSVIGSVFDWILYR